MLIANLQYLTNKFLNDFFYVKKEMVLRKG